MDEALAEPKTKNCSEEILAILLMNGSTQENGKLMFKSPNSLTACRLQLIQGKVTRHCGLGLWVLLGADLSDERLGQ